MCDIFMTEVALQLFRERMAILYMRLGILVIHVEEENFNLYLSRKKKYFNVD